MGWKELWWGQVWNEPLRTMRGSRLCPAQLESLALPSLPVLPATGG